MSHIPVPNQIPQREATSIAAPEVRVSESADSANLNLKDESLWEITHENTAADLSLMGGWFCKSRIADLSFPIWL
ncbi:MAG TPA: hypothetical protein VN132_03310 [Bdellovibrio sp.]|nr:hypothetical protein [Bdellovibrio sp.]